MTNSTEAWAEHVAQAEFYASSSSVLPFERSELPIFHVSPQTVAAMTTHYLRPSPPPSEIWLHTQPVDFRKLALGLASILELELGQNPFSGALYDFINRHYNRIKCLQPVGLREI